MKASNAQKSACSSSADKMKTCLTIFGEEAPSRLWQSVELGPFLCMQCSQSPMKWGEGVMNVELALAAVCTDSCAMARGELAQAPAGGGSSSCVFVFPGLANHGGRLILPAPTSHRALRKGSQSPRTEERLLGLVLGWRRTAHPLQAGDSALPNPTWGGRHEMDSNSLFLLSQNRVK